MTPRTVSEDLWKAPDLVPSLVYSDVPRAVEWLGRVFGFHERQGARLTWAGGTLAWIEIGNSLFSLSTADETWGEGDTGMHTGFVMKAYVDDVDAHFARAKAEGATIVLEPQDGFWGGRIYRALDHERHRWEISQRGRDLAADRWELPAGVTRSG